MKNAPADHAGRRYLIAGGASGIGLAFARLAVAHGACVFLLDNNGAALASAAQGNDPLPGAYCDVTSSASVALAVEQAASLMQGVDGVVNCAGVDLLVDLDAMTDAQWDHVIAVNLTGPMYICRAALPYLRQAGGGTIVNVSSAAGLSPLAHRSAYCATKAGINMLGKVLAMELAEDGIRVTTVCPGAVDTPLFRTSYESLPDPDAGLHAIKQRYALRRVARPDELADAILYLSGLGASYITGAVLAVDGGRSFH